MYRVTVERDTILLTNEIIYFVYKSIVTRSIFFIFKLKNASMKVECLFGALPCTIWTLNLCMYYCQTRYNLYGDRATGEISTARASLQQKPEHFVRGTISWWQTYIITTIHNNLGQMLEWLCVLWADTPRSQSILWLSSLGQWFFTKNAAEARWRHRGGLIGLAAGNVNILN